MGYKSKSPLGGGLLPGTLQGGCEPFTNRKEVTGVDTTFKVKLENTFSGYG